MDTPPPQTESTPPTAVDIAAFEQQRLAGQPWLARTLPD